MILISASLNDGLAVVVSSAAPAEDENAMQAAPTAAHARRDTLRRVRLIHEAMTFAPREAAVRVTLVLSLCYQGIALNVEEAHHAASGDDLAGDQQRVARRPGGGAGGSARAARAPHAGLYGQPEAAWWASST